MWCRHQNVNIAPICNTAIRQQPRLWQLCFSSSACIRFVQPRDWSSRSAGFLGALANLRKSDYYLGHVRLSHLILLISAFVIWSCIIRNVLSYTFTLSSNWNVLSYTFMLSSNLNVLSYNFMLSSNWNVLSYNFMLSSNWNVLSYNFMLSSNWNVLSYNFMLSSNWNVLSYTFMLSSNWNACFSISDSSGNFDVRHPRCVSQNHKTKQQALES
jgi:hypothetical protein